MTAYQTTDVPTIGYGHTKGVKLGQKITKEQAEKYLLEDIATAEKNVEKWNKKYKFNENQYSALVSFAFNVGSIDALVGNGTRDIETIAEKMLLYTKCGGRQLLGLINRRREERALFKQEVFSKKTEVLKVVAKSGVNLRTNPSMNGRVMKAIPYGTEVALVKNINDDWRLIKYNGVEYYVSRKWVL